MNNKGSRADFTRKERMSWDDFFMQMALQIGERTACFFHKAGSVFVDDNHRIISLGYNGPSTGDYHCIEEGCAKVHGDPVTGEIRRCRGVHGEINAIINAGDTRRLKDSTLYITLFPCYDCMKALNNLGIKRIVYSDEYLRVLDGSDGNKKEAEPESRLLAYKRGIIIEKYRQKTDPINTKPEEDKTETNNDLAEQKAPKSNKRWD